MKVIKITPALLLLSACAVGPDFQSPEAPRVDAYSKELAEPQEQRETQVQVVASDRVPELWWQLFQSSRLEEMVNRGLQASPSVKAAEARLLASRETLSADTASLLFPAVDAGVNSSRQKISGATFGQAGNGSLFTLHNAKLDLSYTIDAFGGGRRYLEVGQAQVEYDAFQLHAARITLASNIANTAISEASLREQIDTLAGIIAAETEQLQLTKMQYEAGAISKTELLNQQTALAQTKTRMPVLQKALAQARHQLATLTGSLPGEAELPRFALDELRLPKQIPLTLPSQLTRQRPDVRAAEAQLHQASASVGIATANLYPKLSLSGSYGTEGVKVADLFGAGSTVWGLGAGLLQPLFRGGELHARKRAAEAEFNRVAAQYRSAVLKAFQEVADALLAIEMDSQTLQLEQQAEALAAETFELIAMQHRQGAVSYLDLLNAQRQYQQTRLNLVQARAALYNDTVALMFALGGGWWKSDAFELDLDNKLENGLAGELKMRAENP